MTVKDAIKMLGSMNPEDDIILAFWKHSDFPHIPKDEWPDAAANAEDETDWSRTHETLDNQMKDFLTVKNSD